MITAQTRISTFTFAMAAKRNPAQSKVALLVTCLVDLFRPSIGFASIKLLQQAGYTVDVPRAQTCCGQPAYNSGDQGSAQAIARQVIDVFKGYDYILAPSGSCAGMIKEHYPRLFQHDLRWKEKADELAGRCFELTTFLSSICKLEINASFNKTVTYHDSCSGLRELGIKAQPRSLLHQVNGLDLKEMEDSEICCGFGGTFCVKYPGISERMVCDKVCSAKKTNAEVVLGGDLGCLLNIAGRAKREGASITAYHVAEVLAGMANAPGIGEKNE